MVSPFNKTVSKLDNCEKDNVYHGVLIIQSHDLFGEKGNLVVIRHGQDSYRLMKTKQGKLLLTK